MAPEFRELVPYFVNFTIVVAICFFAGKKPLRKFIYQRHERMRDAIGAAAAAHEKAAMRAKLARGQVSGLAAEEGALLKREAAGAEQEKKEIIEKGQAEAARVLKESDRLASVEQDEASDRVKGLFLELVISETESTLKRSLKKDDHSAILKRAQNSIEVGV